MCVKNALEWTSKKPAIHLNCTTKTPENNVLFCKIFYHVTHTQSESETETIKHKEKKKLNAKKRKNNETTFLLFRRISLNERVQAVLSTIPVHIPNLRWRSMYEHWMRAESTRLAVWTDCVSHTIYDVHQTNTTCILFGTWENDWALRHKRKRWMCFILFFFSVRSLCTVLFAATATFFSRAPLYSLELRIMDLCLFMISRRCGVFWCILWAVFFVVVYYTYIFCVYMFWSELFQF